MKRILVPAIPPVGGRARPDDEECHHLIKVRRVRDGEDVEILDGAGGCASGRLVLVSKNRLEVEVTAKITRARESGLHLEVAAAIPAQLSTFDGFLPGLTQLGVNVIYLTPTQWSGRLKKGEDKYLARLEKIALQSLKQCGRTLPPKIHLGSSFEWVCRQMVEANPYNQLLHPVEDQPARPEALTRLGLMVGAEAGFSDDEVAMARELGVSIRGLGPRILKMETAVIGVCFEAQQAFGDFAG